MFQSLQHINIVEILGYSWDHGSDVLIVMEYLEEGSLNYYLKFQGDKLRISHLLKYARDIATVCLCALDNFWFNDFLKTRALSCRHIQLL